MSIGERATRRSGRGPLLEDSNQLPSKAEKFFRRRIAARKAARTRLAKPPEEAADGESRLAS
jgi:hypothetical protein